MDSKREKELVELLYDPDIDVGTEVIEEYKDVMYGQEVLVRRYESALPAWIKNRAKRRRGQNV